MIDRVLGGIERIGNKIPEPFILFVLLLVVTAIATTVMAWLGVSVQVPGSDEVTQIRGFFTGEGLTWFTANLGANFIGFPPLAVVLPIIFGVGLAEKTGLLAAMIRWAFGSAPRWALPYAVALVGVLGSIMSDAAFVVIPPLAALVFKAAGRHPVAGLLGGFAAAGAGYSTTMLVTSLDALFAGITTAVAATLPDPGTPVTPISNYFFNVASSVVRTVAAIGRHRILEAAQGFPTPFITKHNQGGKGLGVRKFESHDELAEYVNSTDFEGSALGAGGRPGRGGAVHGGRPGSRLALAQ